MIIAALVFALQAPVFAPVPPETANALRRAARRAESQYESVSRRLVPYGWGSGSGGACDEVVGRFCLHYDAPGAPQRPLEPENRRVTEVRREAVETFRRAFASLPSEIAIVGPLVRYLVEDDRAAEAAAAARTFAWASADSVWGPLLMGFALHAGAQDSAAELEFDQALRHLDEKERRRATRLEPLLGPAERSQYGRLNDAERAAYHRRFWVLADALYLTSGNETRAEHLARYVYARILAKAPVVMSMTSWGSDLEELTVRYGVPRARFREQVGAMMDSRLIERFDPASVALLPESLAVKGFPVAPDPGAPWPLESTRARSGYAPPSVRRIIPLPHQVSRFPVADGLALRVDGQVALDSTAHGASDVRAHVFLVDSTLHVREVAAGSARVRADTARFTLFAAASGADDVYSLEAIEAASRLAARARFTFPPLAAAAPGAPRLSDIVVAEPFGGSLPTARDDARLRGRASLLLERTETIGVYAEVSRLQETPTSEPAFDVELTMQRLDSPAAIESAVRWLGRVFGRSERTAGARVAWRATAPPEGAAAIAVDVNLATMRAGLYDLTLTVHGHGGSTTATRRIRILDS